MVLLPRYLAAAPAWLCAGLFATTATARAIASVAGTPSVELIPRPGQNVTKVATASVETLPDHLARRETLQEEMFKVTGTRFTVAVGPAPNLVRADALLHTVQTARANLRAQWNAKTIQSQFESVDTSGLVFSVASLTPNQGFEDGPDFSSADLLAIVDSVEAFIRSVVLVTVGPSSQVSAVKGRLLDRVMGGTARLTVGVAAARCTGLVVAQPDGELMYACKDSASDGSDRVTWGGSPPPRPLPQSPSPSPSSARPSLRRRGSVPGYWSKIDGGRWTADLRPADVLVRAEQLMQTVNTAYWSLKRGPPIHHQTSFVSIDSSRLSFHLAAVDPAGEDAENGPWFSTPGLMAIMDFIAGFIADVVIKDKAPGDEVSALSVVVFDTLVMTKAILTVGVGLAPCPAPVGPVLRQPRGPDAYACPIVPQTQATGACTWGQPSPRQPVFQRASAFFKDLNTPFPHPSRTQPARAPSRRSDDLQESNGVELRRRDNKTEPDVKSPSSSLTSPSSSPAASTSSSSRSLTRRGQNEALPLHVQGTFFYAYLRPLASTITGEDLWNLVRGASRRVASRPSPSGSYTTFTVPTSSRHNPPQTHTLTLKTVPGQVISQSDMKWVARQLEQFVASLLNSPFAPSDHGDPFGSRRRAYPVFEGSLVNRYDAKRPFTVATFVLGQQVNGARDCGHLVSSQTPNDECVPDLTSDSEDGGPGSDDGNIFSPRPSRVDTLPAVGRPVFRNPFLAGRWLGDEARGAEA